MESPYTVQAGVHVLPTFIPVPTIGLLPAPETTMVHDSRLDALFSSDCFGAPLAAPVEVANELPDDRLEQSELLWAGLDAPWIHHVERERFAARLGEIADLDPAWIFSAHLPPARRMARTLCRNLGRAPDAAPYLAPDQPAFEAMLRGMATPAAAPSSPPA